MNGKQYYVLLASQKFFIVLIYLLRNSSLIADYGEHYLALEKAVLDVWFVIFERVIEIFYIQEQLCCCSRTIFSYNL